MAPFNGSLSFVSMRQMDAMRDRRDIRLALSTVLVV